VSNRPAKKRSSSAKIQAASRASKSSNAPIYIIVGVLAVAGIALIAAIASTSGGGANGDIVGRKAAPAALVTKVTTVPTSVFTKVGVGTSQPLPQPINGKSIAVNGKPGVLYIGAEYCPFCATERWAMVNALSRFGTFTGLNITNSSTTDTDPATRTLSFYKSKYTSNYIVFTSVEEADNTQGKLETPTAAQQAILTSTGTTSIPFIYFNGEYLISGATYDVAVLQGKSWDQIATAMSDPTSAVAKGAIGAANAMTATICITTKNQPSTTCALPVIQDLEKQIKAQPKSTTSTTNPNSSSSG
jgi:Domain of unknown function (DUF929)